MYINGKEQARDKGGVGVQNMKDWTQKENFFVGRNVGGNGEFFANFYIASFVVFNNFLKAQGVYSVYKYYNNDGKIFLLRFQLIILDKLEPTNSLTHKYALRAYILFQKDRTCFRMWNTVGTKD